MEYQVDQVQEVKLRSDVSGRSRRSSSARRLQMNGSTVPSTLPAVRDAQGISIDAPVSYVHSLSASKHSGKMQELRSAAYRAAQSEDGHDGPLSLNLTGQQRIL